MLNYRLGYLMKNQILILAINGAKAKTYRQLGSTGNEDP